MHRLVLVGRERAQRGGDVGRLRVVDVADAVQLADELEPVGDARECAQSLGDPIVRDPGRPGGGSRGGGVLAVVGAAHQRLRRERIVGGELGAVEVEPARDDLGAGPLEDAQLRVAVGLEAAVPVEVVGLEVEQHRDLAGELVHVLELEARKLADDPRARLDLPVELGQCAADVSRHGSAEHGAEQLAGRRLAVRARDAEQSRTQEPVRELDLAPDLDPAPLGFRHERSLPRDARALYEHVDAVEQAEVTVVPELPVGREHLHPAPRECRNRSLSGPSEPEHERPPWNLFHRPVSTPSKSASSRRCIRLRVSSQAAYATGCADPPRKALASLLHAF